jgi:hypothetical protein
MKCIVTWTFRDREGATLAEGKANFDAFMRYKLHPDTKFLEWVTRADQTGGGAIVETNNAVALSDAVCKFSAEWDIAPVVDLTDEKTLAMYQEAYGFNS